jgi:hypothetical protein
MAAEAGLDASRIAEGGNADLGDIWISLNPGQVDPDLDTALAWKRLTSSSGKRRTPDGVRHVAVVELRLLLQLLAVLRVAYQSDPAQSSVPPELLALLPDAIVVEAKATQQLNVTRTLANAIRKVKVWKRDRALQRRANGA